MRDGPERRPIPPAVRLAVFERDGYACRFCGGDESLQIDHVEPWSQGGSDEPDNLQTLCGPCNRRKGPKRSSMKGQPSV